MSQHTKISSFSVYQQWTSWERNQENNSIHNSLKKILKYKPNKEKERSLKLKLQNHSEIEEDIRIERPPMFMNIVKMAKLPKSFYRSNATLIKIPISWLTEILKAILRFILKNERPWIA
jgi:hypothetical protein